MLKLFLDDNGRVKNKLHYFLLKEDGTGNYKPLKKTILMELGKVACNHLEKDVLYLADEICRNKFNTNEAINFIREKRGLRKNKIIGIVKKIIKILDNAYITKDEMIKVLQITNIAIKHCDQSD